MQRVIEATDSALLTSAIALVCCAAFLFPLIARRDGDISRFVVAGAGVDASKAPPGLTVRHDIAGYDGVAFYRFAVAPFDRSFTRDGITLDNPPYRQQRIAYPLLVHVLSFGHVQWIPFLLVAVNVAGIAILGALGALIARHFGQHALWGVLFPLYPGFLFTLSRDLCEIVASCFVLGAVLAIQKGRFIVAGVLLCLGVLTRETVIVVVVALAATFAVHLFARLPRRLGAAAFLLPAGAFAAWQVVLVSWWSGVPTQRSLQTLTIPFVEYARLIAASSSLRNLARLHFSEAIFLGIVAALGIAVWRSAAVPEEWRMAWTLYFALATMLPHATWLEDVAFMRVVSEFFLFSVILVLAAAGRAGRAALFVVTATLWYYLASHLVEFD